AGDNLTAVIVKISGGEAQAVPTPSTFAAPTEIDEDTVATARPALEKPAPATEALELGTLPLSLPEEPRPAPTPAVDDSPVTSAVDEVRADSEVDIKKVEGPTLLPSIVPP